MGLMVYTRKINMSVPVDVDEVPNHQESFVCRIIRPKWHRISTWHRPSKFHTIFLVSFIEYDIEILRWVSNGLLLLLLSSETFGLLLRLLRLFLFLTCLPLLAFSGGFG